MNNDNDCNTERTCVHCGSNKTKTHSNPGTEKLRLKCKECRRTFMPHSHSKKRMKKKAAVDIAMEVYNAEHRKLAKERLNVMVSSGVVLSNRAIAKIVGCAPETVKNWLADNEKPVFKLRTGKQKTKFFGELKTGTAKQCKRCDGSNIVKNGKPKNVQRYLCKDCGHQYTIQDSVCQPLDEVLTPLSGHREYYACHYFSGYSSYRKCQYLYKCPYPRKYCAQMYRCPLALTSECSFPDSGCPYASKCDYVYDYAEELALAYKFDIEALKKGE